MNCKNSILFLSALAFIVVATISCNVGLGETVLKDEKRYTLYNNNADGNVNAESAIDREHTILTSAYSKS